MIEHPAELLNCTNGGSFHGRPDGSLLLHSGGSKRKRHILKFECRPGGFGKALEIKLFQIYRSVNFKYALRSLHRRGFRDIRIVIH